MEGVGDVVLAHLSRSPAGDVQEAVVEREVDVRYQWWDGSETLQKRGKVLGVCGFGRDVYDLADGPRAVILAVPQPDRSRQVFEADDDADEAVRFGRVVGRPQFQDYLILLAQVQGLQVLAAPEVPHVQVVA